MYDELIKEYTLKLTDRLGFERETAEQLAIKNELAEFLEKAMNVGKKPRQEYNPRA